jgi:hypothetical protein
MPKVIFYELSADSAVNYSAAVLPAPDDGDITLFYKAPATSDGVPQFGFHCKAVEGVQTYENKRKTTTIIGTASNFDNSHFQQVEQMAGTYQVWNMLADNDIGECVLSIIEELYSVSTDANHSRVHLDAIKAIFTTGGDYPGIMSDADGTPTALAQVTYHVNTNPWKATSSEGILSLINIIIPAIKYEGFNPKSIREFFLSTRTSNHAAARDLLMVFGAYSHIGNKIAKLIARRVDPTVGKQLLEAVEAMGIKKVDRSKDGLTLPRLVIAFMAEYLVYRKFLAGTLQSQTESSVHVNYKDICFFGCASIREMTGYKEFHIEFSSYIFKAGEDVDIEDEKFVKSYKRWNKVSVGGYNSDLDIHPRMTTAINFGTISARAAVDFIVDGIATIYRPRVP